MKNEQTMVTRITRITRVTRVTRITRTIRIVRELITNKSAVKRGQNKFT